MRDDASFGYRFNKVADGWTWTAFAPGGEVTMRGHAPTKAVAAACVIRALASRSAPAQGTARAA